MLFSVFLLFSFVNLTSTQIFNSLILSVTAANFSKIPDQRFPVPVCGAWQRDCFYGFFQHNRKFVQMCLIMKIRESLSIIFFILLFSANTVARDTVYYYGANGRLAGNPEDARFSKKVKKITRSCYRVKVMKRAGDSWALTRKDRIRTGEDGVQKIWRNEQTFFPRIVQR